MDFCFESTYEELKPGKWPPMMRLILVLSLPMRNWNKNDWFNECRLSFVLSLPMRNWNLSCSTRKPTKRSRFESTYEELKLLQMSLFTFKPIVLSLPMRNWNTIFQNYNQHNKNVLSLPMRNWNAQFVRDYNKKYKSFESTYEELKPT